MVGEVQKASEAHKRQSKSIDAHIKFMGETEIKEYIEDELDEQFDYVLLDKDNKIVARASGKNAKKEMESSKKSAHLPPMRIPKAEVSKMKVYPINPKDKKSIGDMVIAIGEEVELDENASRAFDRIIKDGGIDKKDFQKAKQLYMKKDLTGLRKFIYNLDTAALEAVMDVISRNDSKAFMKMYPRSQGGEYMSSIAYAHRND